MARSQLIRAAVQNLIGGVSQQPTSVRLESQCEVQDNAYSSIVDGLGKRMPSEHVWRADGETSSASESRTEMLPNSKTHIHWINRDSTERYVLMIDPSAASNADTIQIADIATGTKMKIKGPGNNSVWSQAYDYLRAGGDGVNIKTVTVADVSFIANKSVTVEVKDTYTDAWQSSTSPVEWSSRSQRRKFLSLPSVDTLTKYSVRMHLQGRYKKSWEPPLSDLLSKSREVWKDRAKAWVKTFDLNFGDHPAWDKKSPVAKIQGYGSINSDPTYLPLSQWTTGSLHEGYMIGTVDADTVLRRLWSEAAEGIHEDKGTTKSPATVTYYPGGIEAVWNTWGPQLYLFDYILGERKGNFITPPTLDGVMKIELHRDLSGSQYHKPAHIVVVESGGSGGTGLLSFGDETPRFTDLPLVCEHDHVVKITGVEDVEADAYYVKFQVEDEEDIQNYPAHNMGKGHWVETCASLSQAEIDPWTMPLELKRVPDSSAPLGFRFELHMFDWGVKNAGDEITNPAPSFVGREIEDVFLWRNRLGMLAGSRLIMSEADEFTNFWRTTVQSLKDSDPIDLDAGHNRVARLRFATPLEQDLIIWSDRTQFHATADPLLTPRTATLAPVTEFEAYADVRPEVVGGGIYYAFPAGGGSFSQVSYYRRRSDISDTFDTFRSTAHAPRYIKGKVVEMTATSLEEVLAVRSADTSVSHVVYIHKWVDRGSDRLLSAWMRFLFDSGTIIYGMEFIDDVLHMLMRHDGQAAVLEKIVFAGQRQVDDDGTNASKYRTSLDRRVTEADCTFAYVTATSSMTVTLPYTASTGATVKMLSRMGSGSGPEGEQFSFTQSVVGDKTVLTVSDPQSTLYDLSVAGTLLLYIGETYTMTYEFSTPSLRERKQEGGGLHDIKTGRYQLLRGSLSYEDSGYFDMQVAPAVHTDGDPIVDRASRSHKLPLLEVGMGRSKVGGVNTRDGVMKFGIYSSPDLIRLIIVNDSPYPSNPKSLEIEANYSRRSRMSTF